MGGAWAGLADDANALLTNPAGLVTVPKAVDVAISIQRAGAGGDSARGTWLSPGFAGLALHPWKRVALGLGVAAVRDSVQGAPVGAARTADWKQVDLVPVGLAVRLSRHAAAGLALRTTRFSASASAHGADRTHGPGGSEAAVSLRGGVLLQPSPQLRAGLVYQQARRWELGPEASTSLLARTAEVYSAGVSWRADFANSARLLVATQSDLLRDRPPAGSARLGDEAEWRVGAELSKPFQCYAGCGSMWQVRAGLHSQAPLGVVGAGAARHLNWTLGASLALRSVGSGRWRLDLAGGREAGRAAVQAGVAFRYSESFRSDLRYRRPRVEPDPSADTWGPER